MWGYNTLALQAKRAIAKYKKRNTPILSRGSKESNLEKLQFEYLNFPINKSIIFLKDYGKNKMSGDMLALLCFALKEEKLKAYSFVLALSSFYDMEQLRLLLKDDLDRVDLVAFDSIQYRIALETSGVIISSAGFPKYYIRRPEQLVVGIYGFKSIRKFFDGNQISPQKISASLNYFDFFFTPLFSSRQELFEDISKFAKCSIETIKAYPRFDLRMSAKENIIFCYRGDFFYRLCANFEKIENWVEGVDAALSSKNISFSIAVPGRFYEHQYNRDNRIKSYTFPLVYGLVSHLNSASILVTDYLEDIYVAQSMRVPFIYVGDSDYAKKVFFDLELPFADGLLYVADSHTEALEWLNKHDICCVRKSETETSSLQDFGNSKDIFYKIGLIQ